MNAAAGAAGVARQSAVAEVSAMNAINSGVGTGGEYNVLATAQEDHESVIELTRDLVTIPSRGGIDSYEEILDRVSTWLDQHHVPGTALQDETGAVVGLTYGVTGCRPG